MTRIWLLGILGHKTQTAATRCCLRDGLLVIAWQGYDRVLTALWITRVFVADGQ